MSTLKAANLQNGSSASTNIVLNTDGSATFNQIPVGPSYFAMRNKIINGAMEIDQRNGGASVTPTNAQYITDRWACALTAASKFTAQQASASNPVGFPQALRATSSSAYSVLTGDIFAFYQRIEGNNIADLEWGTANAKTITISFWARSSLTGTFGGALQNSGPSRSYPFSYSISAANTWEYKTITIPGDTTGTWLTTNGIGINLAFSFGAGATYSATAGSWAAGNYWSPTGAVSVVGTNGATFYITGVQFEVGSVATPFERRSYGLELLLCQRYFEIGQQPMLYIGFGATGISAAYGEVRYAVTKRASPTVAVGTSWQYYSGGGGVNFTPATTGIADRFYWANAGFTNWNGWTGGGTWTASAEL